MVHNVTPKEDNVMFHNMLLSSKILPCAPSRSMNANPSSSVMHLKAPLNMEANMQFPEFAMVSHEVRNRFPLYRDFATYKQDSVIHYTSQLAPTVVAQLFKFR